ncbi:DUF3219 family protein [Metabacillus halosaccharovorans]|uniref:DUF3219 family protein n=1 Tax=Metabacillus halosaccharovorans TaxID=930124 RepID=UPI001C1FD0D0|nr:DUF3219 family protein [Metabacillus halosaccharovorans]MBU7592420.1 DUF3219 family protein [Metabacillus halosaccharovorans]
MVTEVYLNDTPISITKYEEKSVNNLIQISVEFLVTSDDYHDITTLLYKNTFHIKIPERNITFHGVINNYSTSLTNLYKENQVSKFSLQIIEQLK